MWIAAWADRFTSQLERDDPTWRTDELAEPHGVILTSLSSLDDVMALALDDLSELDETVRPPDERDGVWTKAAGGNEERQVWFYNLPDEAMEDGPTMVLIVRRAMLIP